MPDSLPPGASLGSRVRGLLSLGVYTVARNARIGQLVLKATF
jgi:hypothetical protein